MNLNRGLEGLNVTVTVMLIARFYIGNSLTNLTLFVVSEPRLNKFQAGYNPFFNTAI